jgi:hypothetical protein
MIPQLNQTTTQTPGLNITPTNLTGAVASYDQSATGLYQAQMAQQGALYNALGNLGGGLLGGMARPNENGATGFGKLATYFGL